MTFNGAELPDRDFPDGIDARPLIATEIGEIKLLLNGKDGMKPPMSAHGIGNRALTAVLTRWKGAKLIEDYDPPGDLDREADYRLRISGTQNEQGSILGAFVTGLTLFLFPSSTTLEWDWEFELADLKADREFTVSTKNSMTQWMHLFFLPAFPFFFVGALNADSSLSHYVYAEFERQGAWIPEAKAGDQSSLRIFKPAPPRSRIGGTSRRQGRTPSS
jgi:hypothetical protein